MNKLPVTPAPKLPADRKVRRGDDLVVVNGCITTREEALKMDRDKNYSAE